MRSMVGCSFAPQESRYAADNFTTKLN